MKLVKQIFQPVIKFLIQKNLVTEPRIVDLKEKQCIGYRITTSFKGNQKKKDIPPFWHDIYDNDKLSALKKNDDDNMYCIFDFHDNGKDFDYYVAVENKAGMSDERYSEIILSKGKYVRVEFMKRNHTAAALIAGYIKKIWIELNGYKERNSPAFILYDERFDQNYKKHGCKGKDYLGDPFAALHVPLQ